MPQEKVPIEHMKLLLYLKKKLTTNALEDMKLAVTADKFGGFQDAELEKIKNVVEMLRELEVRGVLGVGEYGKLKDIMRFIDNVAVLEEIDQTQKLLYEKGYGTESADSNTEMTSKRVSKPHQPLDDSSGYDIESEASNTEMTSKRVSQPHQPLDDSSGEIAPFMVTEGPLQAADKVEEILRHRYTDSHEQIIPWVRDDRKPINDIYTKLKLQNTDHKREQLKSYEEFFLEKTNEGHLIQRIILEGVAGIGKSTLVDKMAYDWANGKKLQEYKLVFVLKMLALIESSEFIDAIFGELIDEDKPISKDDLMSYITTNPAKVLILFDGFDEFKTANVSEMSKSSGYVSRILSRKILRGSSVVVTTRPSHFPKLVSKSLIEKPFVRVLVEGFNGEDIEQYIHRFFSKEPDEAEEGDRAERLIQKIKSSHVLLDLAKSPMLLLLMCILWREKLTIPNTMYRLYKKALRYIFRRKYPKTTEVETTQVETTQVETTQVVITIGEKALDDLLSPHQFPSFKEGDFEEQALRSALKAGILTSQRVIKGLDTQHIVSFIHRTFQEYFAAIFFQSLLGTDEEQFNLKLDRVRNIMKDGPQGLEYFLRFCCGDNQACTNKVLNLIQTYPWERNEIQIPEKEIEELSVLCYFEGQFKDLPSVDLITEYMNMYIEEYSTDGLHALFYYLKNVNADDKKKNRETAQLSKVEGLYISSCNLESFGKDLGEVMSGMTNLSRFKLDNCKVTPASMEYIASSFVSTPYLTSLDILMESDEAQSIGHSVVSWGHNLRSLTLLKWFTFKGCDLQDKDLKYVAASLGLMKNLVHCEICIDNHPFLSYIHPVGSVPPLTVLRVCSCLLTTSELSDILSGLKTREDNFSIHLSGNPLLGSSANIWAQYLKDLKHLERLHLAGCALQSKDIEPLAGSLSDMSTLATLDLSGNPSLGGNAASWAVHLGQLNPLDKMSLGNCSLTSVDIEPIAKSVGNIGTLDLSGNEELRHSVASWAPSLKHFKHVKKIYLTSCGLSSEDETLISKVQQEMSNNVDTQLKIECVESPSFLI